MSRQPGPLSRRPGASGPMRPLPPFLLVVLLAAVLLVIWYLSRLR
jgi:hypothetical protein